MKNVLRAALLLAFACVPVLGTGQATLLMRGAGPGGGSAPPPVQTLSIVNEGTSLSANDAQYDLPSAIMRYPTQSLGTATLVANRAVSGSRLTNWNSRKATVIADLNGATGQVKVLTLDALTNDAYDSTPAATITAGLATYISDVRAGVSGTLKVVLVEMTSRADASTNVATFESIKTTYNSTINSWVGSTIDGVIPAAQQPEFGLAGKQYDSRFFVDKVHYRHRAQIVVGKMFKRVLDKFARGSDAPVGPTFFSASTISTYAGKPLTHTLVATPSNPTATITGYAVTGGADAAQFSIASAALSILTSTPGTYTVQVTATDSDGATTAQTITVTVKATSGTPIATFGSNLQAWYDISDPGGRVLNDSGTAIRLIRDLSGNGFHLEPAQDPSGTALGGTLPLLGTLNAKAVAENSTQRTGEVPWAMATSGASLALGTSPAFTLFVAGSPMAGATAFSRAFSYKGSGQTNEYGGTSMGLMLRSSAGTGVMGYTSADLGTSVIANDTMHVLTSTFSGTQHTMRADGVAGTTVAFSSARSATGDFWIGSLGASMKQKYGEVVLVKGAVAGGDITTEEARLTAKWM